MSPETNPETEFEMMSRYGIVEVPADFLSTGRIAIPI